MARFVLDTNVISELVKPRPSQTVLDFLGNASDIWVSVMVFHELAYGIERCADPVRKARLLIFINALRVRFKGRTIVVDTTVSETAGRLRALAASQGRILDALDALMGATALEHGATLATRNTKDLANLGIRLVDPWT